MLLTLVVTPEDAGAPKRALAMSADITDALNSSRLTSLPLLCDHMRGNDVHEQVGAKEYFFGGRNSKAPTG